MANANGQPLECDAVEPRLLDLVYGELAEDEAGAVRAHAAGCDACGRSLAKLEGGRAVARKMDTAEDAPPAVMGAVLAAARAKAGENQRAAARARIAATEAADARPPARSSRAAREAREGSWLGDLLRKLGSIATGPQVAMALLLLLMVGIGLWSAPRMTSREHTGTTAVLQPDPDGEAGPSAGALTPAEPLRLEVDPRTDRIIDAEELAQAEERRRESGEQRAAQARTAHPAPVEGERAQVERGAEEQVAAESRGRSMQGRSEADEAVEAGDDPEQAAVAALETELAPGEGVGRSVEAGDLREPSAAAGSSVASRERVATSVPATAPPPAMAPVAPSQRAGSYGGATADAVEAPALDTGEALAASLHQQAREAGSSGRYAQCVSTYQQVLDRYPTYAQTGRALLEMAECQRRMGQVTVAERTLERAQRYAAVRPDAERRLSTLRAERAAMDRAAAEMEERATTAAPASE